MMKKDNLLVGMALGAIVGAFFVQSNKKAQDMVQKGKAALKKKIGNM